VPKRKSKLLRVLMSQHKHFRCALLCLIMLHHLCLSMLHYLFLLMLHYLCLTMAHYASLCPVSSLCLISHYASLCMLHYASLSKPHHGSLRLIMQNYLIVLHYAWLAMPHCSHSETSIFQSQSLDNKCIVFGLCRYGTYHVSLCTGIKWNHTGTLWKYGSK